MRSHFDRAGVRYSLVSSLNNIRRRRLEGRRRLQYPGHSVIQRGTENLTGFVCRSARQTLC